MIFWTIITIGIIVTLFIGYSKSYTPIEQLNNSHSTIDNSLKLNEPLLYKKEGIKDFEIRGIYYRPEITLEDKGIFLGTAQCAFNIHDQYAVEIHLLDGRSLGYVPRGNKRLYNSLEHWHEEKSIAWGRLYSHENRIYGRVYIPIGLKSDITDHHVNLYSAIKKFDSLNKKKEKSLEDLEELMNIHKKINRLKSKVKMASFNHKLPLSIIPSYSGKLEKLKEWDKLVKLIEFEDDINALSERYKLSTLKRIEKGFNKIHKQIN